MNSYLAVAEQAARAAGRIVVERFRTTREIRFKGFRDIVTDADLAANETIRQILSSHFPAHQIRSEEDREPPRDANTWTWSVDPLDGTTNYSRQYPVFCVSLALLSAEEPVAGVVYDPLRDELYAAAQEEGTTLNGERVAVSQIQALGDSIIGFEFSSKQRLRESGLARFSQLAARSFTARIGGAAALSLCYVAAGRMDVYFHYSLNSWDVAAGMLMVREAGGLVTDMRGGRASHTAGNFLVSNGALHPALLALFRQDVGFSDLE